jgi:hypothetical protein
MSDSSLSIRSGGQTGADRAALDWAIKNGVPHVGWCPKGRRTEDGPLDERYQLTETPSAEYVQRTEWNVRDSDGTVIFSIAKKLTGGSKLTADYAKKRGKPLLHLSAVSRDDAAEKLEQFFEQNQIRQLNVAGPRASKEPGVGAFVMEVFGKAFGP